MRKGFNIASIAGAVAMAVSGSSFAAGHPAFSQWSLDGDGNIANYCQTTNFSCDPIASGTGFVQFMAKNKDTGETFVGTIVADQSGTNPDQATGTQSGSIFSDESYIKAVFSQGGSNTDTNGGIAAKQSINERSFDGVKFESEVLLQTGTNFSAAGTPTIQINQSLNNGQRSATQTTRGDDFLSDFLYAADTSGTGTRDGFIMEIDQIAGLQTANDTTSNNDVQSFTYREAAGTMQRTDTTGRLGVNSADINDPNSTNVVTYVDKDDIKAVWLGQTINIGMTDTTGTGLGGAFSYLSFENKGLTTGATPSPKASPDVVFAFDLTSSDGPNSTVWPTSSPFNLTFQTGVDSAGNPITSSSGAPTLDDPSGGRL